MLNEELTQHYNDFIWIKVDQNMLLVIYVIVFYYYILF